MANDTEIAVVLKLVADQFQSDLKKSQGLLGDFNRFINDWKTQLTAVGGAMLAVTKSTADAEESLQHLGEQLGSTAQFMASLQYAARMADVEMDQVSATLGILDKNLVAAAQGDEAKIRAFEQLGIAIKGTNGQIKPLDQLVLELNEKFRTMPDGPVKTGLAVQVMGRSAKQVLPLFNSDIQAAIDRAKQLGLVMSDENVQAAKEFNDHLRELQAMSHALTLSVGNDLIPILNQLLQVVITLKSSASSDQGFTWMGGFHTQMILANGLLKEMIANIKAVQALQASTQQSDTPQWVKALKALFPVEGLLAPLIKGKLNPASPQGDILADLNKQIAGIEAETQQKLYLAHHPNVPKDIFAGGDTKRGGSGQPDVTQVDSQKKTLEARKALLDAEEKLNQARIKGAEGHLADWQRLLDADRTLFTAKIAFDGEALGYSKVNANTERDLLAERTAQQQKYLDDQRVLVQAELDLMAKNQAQQRAVLQAKTSDEAKQAKTKASKADIEEAGRIQLEALQKTQQAEQLPLQNKLKSLALDKQITDLQSQAQLTGINRGVTLAKIDNDRAVAQQDHANALAMIDQRRSEGELTAADALKAKLREDAAARQTAIDIEERASKFRSENDAEYQKSVDALARLKTQHAQQSALEARQIAHAQTQQDLQEAVTVAQSKEEVLKLSSFSLTEIAQAHVETLKAQYAKDLENFQGTEQEKAAFKRLKDAELQQATSLATGNWLNIYQYGLQQYLTNTNNTFNIAIDMARTTAQGMEQGFQTFFFDTLNNKFHSLTDVLTSVRNFAFQIVSQVAAKLATAGLLQYAGSALGNLLAINPQALNTSGQFTTTAPIGPGSGLGHFAGGGSFVVGGMGGVDSKLVQFFATPGERVDVTTPEQQAARAGGLLQPVSVETKTEINVINQHPGAEVQTSRSQGSGGQQIIQFLITQVKQAMAAGEFDRTLQSNFGLSRQGVAR